MWEENQILKMMQTNFEIFGNEILQIKDADDDWLINYFEKRLYEILDCWVLMASDYSKIYMDGWGLTHDKSEYKKFNLNTKQCVKLFEYIYPRYYIRNSKVCLNKFDSEIILNYIDKGYNLNCYKLVYYGNKKENGNDK